GSGLGISFGRGYGYYPGYYNSWYPGYSRYYGSSYWPGYGSYYSYSPSYYYSTPSYGYGVPDTMGYSYGAPDTMPAESTTTAHVDVQVPRADAEIWFEGTKTQQTGTFRQFESPPLTPGRDYTYEVRARWFDNGKEINRTRRVPVHAGEQ